MSKISTEFPKQMRREKTEESHSDRQMCEKQKADNVSLPESPTSSMGLGKKVIGRKFKESKSAFPNPLSGGGGQFGTGNFGGL